jgi:hypothetical protein
MGIKMSVYASETTVDSSKSRAEIERTLARYGATSFSYGWEEGRAAIAFVADGRQVRFILPLPDRNHRDFTHTPSTKKPRSPLQAEVEYEKAVRQRWRALALVVKAKLEAVNAGIVTFEQEFYAHTVLPNGSTVYEHTKEAVEHAYLTGVVPPMLAIPAAV